MSEHNAPNSILNNDKNNINNIQTPNNNRKRKSNMQNEAVPKHLKNNYYAVLDNDKQCNKEYLEKFEKHVQQVEKPTTSKNSIKNNSPNYESIINNDNPTNNSRNKNKKVPPINIFDIEPNELIDFIKNGLKINQFKIKEFNNKKISLYMSERDDYNRVKAYLEKTKVKFFTFTPKDIKTKTYVLKGLSANEEINVIYEELCKYQNENLKFIKVSQFTTKKATNNGYDLPIYLVQISGESKVNELKSINNLLYRCIRWEALKKPEIAQCRNCQSFFHSASNCFLPSRCVKCKERHEIGKCAINEVPENEREKLFCVLCNKYGHPASYKGCEKYKELQLKLRSKKQSLSQRRTNDSPNYITPNMSFANVLKNNNSGNENKINPIQQALMEFTNSMQNLSNQIINLQKQLQIQVSRIDTIFQMLEA